MDAKQIKETPLSCTLAILCGHPRATAGIGVNWKSNIFWASLSDGLYSKARGQVSADLTTTKSTLRFTYNLGLLISRPSTLIMDIYFHFLIYFFFFFPKYWKIFISSIWLHVFCLYVLGIFFQTLFILKLIAHFV